MPLRRHPRSPSFESQCPISSKRSRPSTQPSSPVASSSRLPSSSNHTRQNGVDLSPNGKVRNPLSSLLASPHSSRHSVSSRRVIQLLDSSDDEEEAPKLTRVKLRSAQEQIDLEDITTPPLPPADDAAPTLPESIDSLPGTPPLPQGDDSVEEVVVIEDSEVDPQPAQPTEPPSPPVPPPDPLARQRPIFNPEELQMDPLYDELKALLETAQESDDEDDEDYEERRQRKLRANDALLAQLGLAASGSKSSDPPKSDAEDEEDDGDDDVERSQTQDTPARGRGRPRKRVRAEAGTPSESLEPSSTKKKKYDRKVKFADDGTTKSAPLPGESFVLAYIDLPALRERARNEYVFIQDVPEITAEDLANWSEDEQEEEQDEPDDDPFEDAVATKRDSLGRLMTKRVHRQPDVLPDGTELSSCHQCRRKTADAKMRCQRIRQDVQCSLQYCRRCITVRYGFTFDANDKTFHCPRCQGYCNCSVCLRRSGFGELVSKGRERLLAFSTQLRKLAGQEGLDSMQRRIGAILAETAVLEMDVPAPTPRRSNVKGPKRESEPTVDGVKRRGRPPKQKGEDTDDIEDIEDESTLAMPKKRGRPPKKRIEDEAEAELAVKIERQLSDEVPEGDVFSPLEEDTLGRLAVARRVLKMVADARVAAANNEKDGSAKRRFVVRLKIPAAKANVNVKARATPLITSRNVFRKTSDYHDREKDVWIRSAADISSSSSDIDELEESDQQDDADGADDPDEVEFGGRTHLFACSMNNEQGSSSSNVSRGSSPLTSLEASRSSSFASSRFERDESLSLHPELMQEATPVSSHASVSMPQDMQHLALAVLGNDAQTIKEIPPGFMSHLLQESPAFPTLSGSDTGQLGASLDADPRPATPILFGEDTYADD